MSADLLALLDRFPATGILAVADLREQRATAATQGPWIAWQGDHYWKVDRAPDGPHVCNTGRTTWNGTAEDAVYIAADHPEVALAAVRRWRDTATRHGQVNVPLADGSGDTVRRCKACGHIGDSDCRDIALTADEARAYAGGAA
jgi:hypothetical protein